MVEEKEILVEKTTKLNKSLHFILPMLNIKPSNRIVNCYLRDFKYKPELDNYHIFLLVTDHSDILTKHENYLENYTTKNGIMFVFKTPIKFEEDYLKFILGKYSEFSSEYKKQIVSLLPENYQNTNVFRVIMKSPDAKKMIEERIGCSIGNQEVISICSIEEETYSE